MKVFHPRRGIDFRRSVRTKEIPPTFSIPIRAREIIQSNCFSALAAVEPENKESVVGAGADFATDCIKPAHWDVRSLPESSYS